MHTSTKSKQSNFLCACGLGALLSFVSLTGCANTPGQESAGQYIDNSVLTAQVKKELLADPSVKSLPITVTSYKGRVMLSGFVDSNAQKERAVRIASAVSGVEQVEDKLSVK